MTTTEVLSLAGLVLNAVILPIMAGVWNYMRTTDTRLTRIETKFEDHDQWERKVKHKENDTQ